MNPKPSATRPQLATAETRHRLSHWRALGLVPPDVAPCAIAAALTRLTGRPPARDRQTRIYTRGELLAALAELERTPAPRPRPAPPPVVAPPRPAADALAAIWWAALERLGLPSTRMLLSHQARLAGLAHSRYARRADGELVARVSVRGNWLPMVTSRRDLVANALTETLARPVAVELVQEVGR